MANRFDRLFQLPNNLYIEGAPVILAAGALLKDNESGSIIAQLKFQSVSERRIKAVKVSLSAFDVSRTEVQGVPDYQYLEMNISNGQEFGANKAIVMPISVTRSFTVSSVVVVFQDGSMWESEGQFAALHTTKSLSFTLSGAELEKQYRIATNESAKFSPAEDMGLWQCACGTWNSSTNCTHCRIIKDKVFSVLDIAALTEHMNIRLAVEKQQREEAERIAAENAAKQREIDAANQRAIQKRNKLLVIIGTPILALVLLFVLWINPSIIQPRNTYAEALSMLEEKNYEEAYELFVDLGDYKDSSLHTKAFEWICVEEYASGYKKTLFNDFGKPIHQDVYYLDHTVEYEYDSNNLLTCEIETQDDGDLWDRYDYIYNELGLLEIEINESLYSIYTTSYRYDVNGYLVYERTLKRDKDGGKDEFWREINYTNREDGLLLKSVAQYDDGEVSMTEYEYDQNNNVVKRSGSTTFTYAYDYNGNCVSWIESGGNNRTYSAEYEYDEFGNKTKLYETFYDGDTRETRYTYQLIYNFEKAAVLIDPSSVYAEAETLLANKQFFESIRLFSLLGEYEDSSERIRNIYENFYEQAYVVAEQLLHDGNYSDAVAAFTELGDYKDSPEQILAAKYAIAEQLLLSEQYSDAALAFEELGSYKDSTSRKEEALSLDKPAQYAKAEELLADGQTEKAAIIFGRIPDYSDAADRSWNLWNSVAQRNALAAGQFSTLGIRANGSVVVVGGSTKYDFSQWTNIVSVCGGDSHYVGLKADGTVIATGYDADGQCNVLDWTNIVSISAGSSHTVGLRTDGTVIAVGNNELGQCDVSDWVDIIAIATGDFHTVGIKADGTVVAAGNNGDGQCEVSDWTNIVSVSAGIFHTVGLKSDGTVVAVGDNSEDQCQVSQWTDIVAIVAGRQHSVGLKSDGTLVVAGNRWADECQVSSWENIVAIGAGNWHTVGLTKNGTVVATGSNKYGQCDVSDWKNIRIPD